MNIIIVEDEKPALEKLEIFVKKYDPDINIVGRSDSIKKTIELLKEHQHNIDLILMDIQLTDGTSFEIFNQIKVNAPVIFITAYNEYAIEAFKVNSIDYILKPLEYKDLCGSLDKYKNLKKNFAGMVGQTEYEALESLISGMQKKYKNRFMIKVGEHIKSVTTDKIALFYAEGRNVSLLTMKGREYIIDFKLEELENLLDPALFFRTNRTFIINIDAITDVIIYSNSRLKIITEPKTDKETIVSREKVNDFKQWFDGRGH